MNDQTEPNPKTFNWADIVFTIIFESLFWLGAFASATQGFFSINDFVKTLTLIPSFSFIASLPFLSIITFLCATTIFIYALKVEQQIFKPNFRKLLVFLLKKINIKISSINSEGKKDNLINYDKETRKLKQKIQSLNAEAIDAPESKKPKDSVFFNFIKSLHVILAYSTAMFIVSLRAIVSIGSTMLGLEILFMPFLNMAFGFTVIPVFLIPLFALISGDGYFVKTAQNIVDQFNQTLQYFQVDVYTKRNYNDYKKQYTKIIRDKIAQLTGNRKKLKQSEQTPKTNTKKEVVKYVLFCLFIIGAIGASMNGFFSIPKFFSQMSTVPALAFLSLIPAPIITSFAVIIAVYTLISEQRVLYDYFCNLFLSKLGLEEEFSLESRIETLTRKINATCKEHQTIVKLSTIDPKDNIPPPIPKSGNFFYRKIYLNFAKAFSVFILLLRAISSIVPSTLGLAAAATCLASLGGITILGAWVYVCCALMASDGYLIKCSQNLDGHYNGVMNSLPGIENQDNSNWLKERVKALELIELGNNEILYATLSKQTTSSNSAEQSKDIVTGADRRNSVLSTLRFIPTSPTTMIQPNSFETAPSSNQPTPLSPKRAVTAR